MYKHTYTSTAERYLLDEKLQEHVISNVNVFLKKIELSLIYTAYPKINEEILNEQYEDFEQLRVSYKNALIKERIKEINLDNYENLILSLDESTSKKILISLYEYYLREEMIEYTDFWSIDEVKKVKKEKIEQNFKSFLIENDENDYIDEFDKDVKKIFANNEMTKELYLNRPTYFLLYRVRNNILREVGKKICSEKHIRNMIKDINKKYRELYVRQYNEVNYNKISMFEEMKKDIFQHIEEGFLENIRNGKVVNIGNELANKFKEELKKDEQYDKLISKYMYEITNKDGFEILEEKCMEFQQKYSEVSSKYIDEKTKINENWLKDDLKTFLLYCTAKYIIESDENNSTDISKDRLKKIEEDVLKLIKTEYFSKAKYDVFVKIKNIELDQNEKIKISNVTFIKNKELKDNLERYLKHNSSRFEKDFFKNEEENEQELFAMVEDIETYKRDCDFLEQIAQEKINDIINVIYFYTARDETKNYKISERKLIVEQGTDYRLIRHSHASGIFNIQLKGSEWLNNIFDKCFDYRLKNILNSINEYNTLNKERNEHSDRLIDLNKSLLQQNTLYESARTMSILIAGTNIFKYNVKYLYLRFWLIEDYIELFDKKLPYDDFIMERFLNFYKRAINIIFSYSDIKDVNLQKELQQWILKIFPNNYIYKEEKENE